MFREVFKLERLYRASGKKDAALDRELDIMMSNLEEDLHGHFEQKAVEPLAALRRQDPRPLQDESFAEFSVFLALQYFRTPRLMSSVVDAVRDLIDVASAWGLLRTIFATNVAGGLYLQRRTFRIQFLQAGATSEFITGDQPMVNLAGQEDLDLYYPLGPKLALRFKPGSDAPGVTNVALTDAETADYNRRIVAASEAQLYATTETALRSARA